MSVCRECEEELEMTDAVDMFDSEKIHDVFVCKNELCELYNEVINVEELYNEI